MALELRQQLKLSQQLVMTPQLQQAIKLLQLSTLELSDVVQQEIEQNPLLEEDTNTPDSHHESLHEVMGEAPPPEEPSPLLDRTAEVSMDDNAGLKEIDWSNYENEYETPSSFRERDDGDMSSSLDILTKKTSLEDHLLWQLKFNELTEEEERVGIFIIGNLNRDGFLQVDEADIIAETNSSPVTVQWLLALIQDMDPSGVGARNLKESLLLQLSHLSLSDSTASLLVRDYMHFLETRNYAGIAKASKLPMKEILTAVELITGLNPHPGRAFADDEAHFITPDIYVYKMDGEYVIQLNDDGLPRLKISNFYKDILKDHKDIPVASVNETKGYIQEKLRSAMWLIKSIQQRQRTIYKVVESLVKFQLDFFEKGPTFLKPLILRDVADDIEMHESTVSRVTTNKYVHTPQGIYELKYFFNSSIGRYDGEEDMASESIKVKMRQVFQDENSEKPLSDMALSKLFAKENIKIARRTVAKYREQLGILPAKFRKKPAISRR
ncbi:MAG: RNA polymerase factor sigma-54 [Desulfobulbaceae bacterium]|nr:RNA polymerase factor sigma-54 [Desulfobulbaceae bacterium]